MDYTTLLGSLGEFIDKDLIAWRQRGIRGSGAERERFRIEQFHGARAMMRLAVEIKAAQSPEMPRGSVLESLKEGFLAVSTHQADQSGFNPQEKETYVGITRQAYESLAEQYRSEA